MKQPLKDCQEAMKYGYNACNVQHKPKNPFLHKEGFSLLAQSWLLGFKIAKEEYFNSEEYKKFKQKLK